MILGSHLERLPGEDRAPFVDAVLAQLGDPARELRAAEHPRAPTLNLHAGAAAPWRMRGMKMKLLAALAFALMAAPAQAQTTPPDDPRVIAARPASTRSTTWCSSRRATRRRNRPAG